MKHRRRVLALLALGASTLPARLRAQTQAPGKVGQVGALPQTPLGTRMPQADALLEAARGESHLPNPADPYDRAAKAIGLTNSQSVALSAKEVIQ